MKDIRKEIEKLEILITIYSDRDSVRTKQLESQLRVLNAFLLEIMICGCLNILKQNLIFLFLENLSSKSGMGKNSL